MSTSLSEAKVLVIGAGIMGAGIAQVAAQAGHSVTLMDARAGAAQAAKAALQVRLEGLVAKGKFSADVLAALLERIHPVDSLAHAGSAELVIEAIVEDLQAKRALFAQLENLLGPHCLLASNTSSLSITAIAKGLQQPGRVVGMHFFNPVPQMKLVEVVSGLQTEPAVAQAIAALAAAWGKEAVFARSTPGFIVNRIARPLYAEALALLHEQAAPPEVLDACMRAIGFRMGPCELMDLIGHDTNFAVTQAVYGANFFDKRYTPSLVQSALVDGGMLGRKSGRGIYDYTAGAVAPSLPPLAPVQADDLPRKVQLHQQAQHAPCMAGWQAALSGAGVQVSLVADSDWTGLQAGDLQLRQTDGRAASALGAQVLVYDWHGGAGGALAFAASSGASAQSLAQGQALLQTLGFASQRMADLPGLVAARTLAMLVNEAADAVQQGVCDVPGANAAMRLGVNYPAGPFEWLQRWGAPAVIGVLQALDDFYRGERYRVSPWLRHALWQQAHTSPLL